MELLFRCEVLQPISLKEASGKNGILQGRGGEVKIFWMHKILPISPPIPSMNFSPKLTFM